MTWYRVRTVIDDRTCDSCREMDGLLVSNEFITAEMCEHEVCRCTVEVCDD